MQLNGGGVIGLDGVVFIFEVAEPLFHLVEGYGGPPAVIFFAPTYALVFRGRIFAPGSAVTIVFGDGADAEVGFSAVEGIMVDMIDDVPFRQRLFEAEDLMMELTRLPLADGYMYFSDGIYSVALISFYKPIPLF